MTQLCNLPHTHKHGGANCYDIGKCRCQPCRDGNSARTRMRRRLKAYGQWEGLVSSLGTQRRIQGLQFLGFTLDQIGEAGDIYRHTVWRVLNEDTIEPKTRDRVKQAYEVLMRNPEGGSSRRTANQSRRKGYVSPLAWDDFDTDEAPVETAASDAIDEVAVTLACEGAKVALTYQERVEAVTRLHRKRWNDLLIAETLHVSQQTVWRIRQQLRLQAYPYSELVKRGAA